MAKSPLGVRVTTEIESENTIEKRFRSTLAKVKTNLNKTPIQLKATIDASTTANAVNKVINSRAFKGQLNNIQLKTSIDTSQLSKQVQQVLKAITLVDSASSPKGMVNKTFIDYVNDLIKKEKELATLQKQLGKLELNPQRNATSIIEYTTQISELTESIQKLKAMLNAAGQEMIEGFDIDIFPKYAEAMSQLDSAAARAKSSIADTKMAMADKSSEEIAKKAIDDYVNSLKEVYSIKTKIAEADSKGDRNSEYVQNLNASLTEATKKLEAFKTILYGSEGTGGLVQSGFIQKEQADEFEATVQKIISGAEQMQAKFDSIKTENIQNAIDAITDYEAKANAALTRFYSQYGTVGVNTSGVESAQKDLFATINDSTLRSDEKLNKLIKDYQRLSAEITKATAEAQAQNTGLKNIKGFDNLSAKLDRWIEKNKRIKDSSIWPEVQKLQEAVRTYTGTLEENQAEFARLDAEANKLGLTVETLSGKLKRLWTEHFQTAAVMAGIHLVQQGMRGIYQNVVEIDSAMTELKKVTNETDDTYSQFLDNAGERAQRYGSTITDIVNATADAARLGLNIEDASSLADASVVYKNVGDGIQSISDASESVISTMKAFEIEASNAMTIVDKFNEVGKIVA